MRRLLILGFIWGWSFLFIKVAVEGLTPVTVAWSRIALGALALYVLMRRADLRLQVDRVLLRHLALAAAVGNLLPFTLLAWGEQRITSALTAVLNASTPLFTAAFAALAGQERLRRVQVGGLGIGIVGVGVAAGIGGSDLAGSSPTGALAAVVAGACYGLAFVYMRRHLTGIPPLVAATGQLAVGAAMMAPLALATSMLDGVSLTPRRLGAVVLLGVVCTGVAYALNYRIIGELGATKAALTTYIVPVVAVVVGVVVLDEPFAWRLLAGGALTAAGIVGVTRREGAWGSPAALAARASRHSPLRGRARRRARPAAALAGGVAADGRPGRQEDGDRDGRDGRDHRAVPHDRDARDARDRPDGQDGRGRRPGGPAPSPPDDGDAVEARTGP